MKTPIHIGRFLRRLMRGAGDGAPREAAPLYGAHVARSLTLLTAALEPHLDAIVDKFYGRLARMPGAEHLINSLSKDELRHLKGKQKDNLLLLCSPSLTEHLHQSTALRVGRIHALTGLNRATLADGHEMLQAIILHYVDATRHAHALSILYRRLLKELAWQLHAVQALSSSYQTILQSINSLSWNARSYIDLITQATELLAQSDDILGCVLMRPDDKHLFMVEALAGTAVHDLYERIEAQQKTWLSLGEDPMKPGPTRRAWETRRIERCLNYATDESVSCWTPLIQSTLLRSSITIPLVSAQSHNPIALLVIYAKFPGGFSSREQIAFLTQVQSLLIFGMNRLESWNILPHTVPYFVRRRWHALLDEGGLEMHYQPVVDLRTGRAAKVEALARLRDGDQLLTPGQFFPAFSSEDFFRLYVKGLNQALKQLVQWQAQGIALDMSINLPAAGLTDARYVQATAGALKEHGCPPGSLMLELLETGELASNVNLINALDRYLKLGLTLSEDDLGSGYSSLSRLREIPFQVVKIDRSLIDRSGRDSFDSLRFVYQLTRLGHNLGKKVVVEGVEEEDMLEAIALLGADYVQGYVIAKPMPASVLQNWLASPRPLPRDRESLHAAPSGLASTSRLGCRSDSPGNPLVKLARLLTWEEELHLLLDGAYKLPTDQARIRDLRGFLMSMPVSAPEAASAKAELMSSAIASGLRSQAYTQARGNLIAMILEESPMQDCA